MLHDRGYELSEDECNITLAEFTAFYADEEGTPQRPKMSFSARPTDAMLKRYTPLPRKGQSEEEIVPQIGTVHVEFNGSASVGIKDIKAFAQVLGEKNYYTGIFVTPTQPTSSALKIIPSILPTILEIFKEEDLLVNISRHELVPKHILLSPEEKKGLLERYRLKETQLPRISVQDPMARFLGLRGFLCGRGVVVVGSSSSSSSWSSTR